MKKTRRNCKGKTPIIDEIGITSDTLSSRGGLSLFVRYLRNICLAPQLEKLFGSMRKNRKGQRVTEIFKQLLCNFLDGTSGHLVHFDLLKEDVCSEIIPVVSYATTVRRKLIDIAAKIVKTPGKITIKVTSATWKNLKFDVLWKRSGSPPRFVWA